MVNRTQTPRGELVLRRVGDAHEVISNGTFLMDTRGGHSERLQVTAALGLHPQPRSLLIGGLGVGFSLLAATGVGAGTQHLQRIDVVEIEPVLLDWHHKHLAHLTREALADPRVRVVVSDVGEHLITTARDGDRYDVIALDVDNGPDWTVTERNTGIYDSTGVSRITAALAPAGVLSVWSAAPSPAFEAVLRRQFADIRRIDVPVATPRARPDVVYLARRALQLRSA